MEDLIILVCHVTSRERVLKVSCDIMDGKLFSCFIVSHHPVKIGDNKHSGSEDMFFICHLKEQ